MKKKLLSLLLATTVILAGCGNKTNTVDLTAEPQLETEVESQSSEVQLEETTETLPSDVKDDNEEKVDIALRMMSFNGESIEEYIKFLEGENPGNQYSVYNDEYYMETISESERKEGLEEWKKKSTIDDSFKEIFTDEQYGGAFINMDYDDSFQNFKFYVDKDKYKENEFACTLGVGIVATAISDTYQAYNLVLPEDRITEVQIIDNETKEVLETE